MQGRRKESYKYTPFPKEYCQQIQSVLQDYFASKLPKVRWIVQGHIYAKEICILVGFVPEKRLQQKNIILSMDFDPQEEKCKEKVEKCMDLLSDLLKHHLQGVWPHSLQWEKITLRNKEEEIYFKTSTLNTELEAQADRLLAKNSC